MIIDFHKCYGGGGSGSGVTPQDVQRQIDSALTPYWESGETKTYVDGAISGISLDGYYTSAQTEDAISAATSGKADAANVRASSSWDFPFFNSQGIVTGSTVLNAGYDNVNGKSEPYLRPWNNTSFTIYAPVSVGTAGDILVSTGNGAPVWSAVTGPDMSEYYTSAQTEEAITSKNYVTSAQVETQIVAKNYITSGQVNDQIEAYNYVTSADVETQIEAKNYITSAYTADFLDDEDGLVISTALNNLDGKIEDVSDHLDEVERITASAYTELHDGILDLDDRVDDVETSLATKVSSSTVSTIWKGTAVEYEAITVKDPNTFYIIVSSN